MGMTESEWKIMNAVWQRHPASARDVLQSLDESTSWAYSTVKTFLKRLADKGFLTVSRNANVNLYEPTLSREEAQRSEVHLLVERAFDGTMGPLVNLLVSESDLPEKQRRTLQEMIEAEREQPVD
jgi:BlaI family transcriptional regulator, penicillinase repressor